MKKLLLLTPLLLFLGQDPVFAEIDTTSIPGIPFDLGGSEDLEGTALSIKLILLLTILSVAPSILLLMTSFTRIAIVLSFVRTALGTQQMPPTQVIMGLSIILTFFVMGPTFQEVNNQALQPFLEGRLSQEDALDKAVSPMKEFMAKQTRESDLQLFLEYRNTKNIQSVEDIPLTALVPAFAISELKTAFQMGFLIFIPFIIIDMIIASVLMAMGMMMVPPSLISLPFKILLFILVDGWNLVVQSLFVSFK
ncbi:flagellar type III secretion system pore protein FliP [Bacillus sp. EB106-08-02-XG196]|uniref:flagellar type III secretion system pore protein FliP n=1 Tax=Bacillus sp. EB106-08-02-XG196 TaxID=2737049 RepID=UPI0015C459A6|nr:flagellar type III secretion system pore protein FliP [Bacillus sp. EB106-08-02-XG196]NWQ39658.1 flagellar type III secretion system pore protein FliP [Bacillus sp. EB106-08-02-XG196]